MPLLHQMLDSSDLGQSDVLLKDFLAGQSSTTLLHIDPTLYVLPQVHSEIQDMQFVVDAFLKLAAMLEPAAPGITKSMEITLKAVGILPFILKGKGQLCGRDCAQLKIHMEMSDAGDDVVIGPQSWGLRVVKTLYGVIAPHYPKLVELLGPHKPPLIEDFYEYLAMATDMSTLRKATDVGPDGTVWSTPTVHAIIDRMRRTSQSVTLPTSSAREAWSAAMVQFWDRWVLYLCIQSV